MGSRKAKRSIVIPGSVGISRPNGCSQVGIDAAPVALVCRSQASFEAKALGDLVTNRDLRGSSKAAIRLIIGQDIETEINAIAQAAAPPRASILSRQPRAPRGPTLQGEVGVKNLILLTVTLLLAPPIARAQDFPAAELAVGYSMIDVIKGERQTANGATGSITFDFNHWLGAVGDLGVYSAAPRLTAIMYTAGPRLSYRHWARLTPFAQALFGGAHASSAAPNYNGATNAYAFGAGGGTDFVLDHRGIFVLRPQVEYFGFGTIGARTDTVRVSLGMVFRIPRS
jgi:hypothetical protein